MKRNGIAGMTAAGVLALAVGGGIIGGMLSSGSDTPLPVAPASSAPVEVRTVAEPVETTKKEAPVTTPSPKPEATAEPLAATKPDAATSTPAPAAATVEDPTPTVEPTTPAEGFDSDATVCGGRKRSQVKNSDDPELGCATYADGSQKWETRADGGIPTVPTPDPEPIPQPQQP